MSTFTNIVIIHPIASNDAVSHSQYYRFAQYFCIILAQLLCAAINRVNFVFTCNLSKL